MDQLSVATAFALCALVCAVLAWSLWRRNLDAAQGASPEASPRSTHAPRLRERPPVDLPAVYLQHRRLLMRTWDADLPDLQVIAWDGEAVGSPVEFYSGQFFLQLPEDRDLMVAAIERSILQRAMALDDGPMPLDRFRGAWHFFHLPSRERTLAVETVPDATGRLRHRTLFVSPGGAMEPFAARGASSLLDLITIEHLGYRNALATWLDRHEPEAARRQFRNVLETDPINGGAHAWLAAIALHGEDDPDAARRHLAFAEELAPTLPSTRLAAAELRPLRDGNRDVLPMMFEGETLSADGMCLLAQSFLALDQLVVARHICSEVLGREPHHREARALMDQIGEREWRAEA